nr:MAG TPA: hypothetical protein [Caudoviricetes sp.]
MTYIINPMWFYWLSVADKICEATCSLAILLFISSATAYIVAAALKIDAHGHDGFDRKCSSYIVGAKAQRVATVLAVLAVILFAISAFIPSRETLIEMEIARFTTVENAEWALDAVKSATDYIVSAIKELQ